MQFHKATIISDRQLILDSNVGQPAGRKVIVHIIPEDAGVNYSKRLANYYQSIIDTVHEEERALVRQLESADSPIEAEEPWW